MMSNERAEGFAAYVRGNRSVQKKIALVFGRIAGRIVDPCEAFEEISHLAAEEGFALRPEEIAELCVVEGLKDGDAGALEIEELDEIIGGRPVMLLKHITSRLFFEEP